MWTPAAPSLLPRGSKAAEIGMASVRGCRPLSGLSCGCAATEQEPRNGPCDQAQCSTAGKKGLASCIFLQALSKARNRSVSVTSNRGNSRHFSQII